MNSYGQGPDCSNAATICSDSAVVFTPSGPGIDDFANPNNDEGCITGFENQSAWYYFEIQSTAPVGLQLGFTISPNGGFGEDYDFAVYGPNVDCNNLGSPIRCSYAADLCTFCPQTGLGNGATDLSEDFSGDGFVAPLDVLPGQGYFIMVDNYTGSSNGFQMTWSGTASQFLDCCAINVNAGTNMEFCESDQAITINLNGAVTNTSGGPLVVSWDGQFLSDSTILDPVVTIPPNFTGTLNYILSVEESGCLEQAPLTITIDPLGTIAINDTTICGGEFIGYSLTGFDTYSWSPATGVDCPVCPNVFITPQGNTTYVVTGSTTSGCLVVDSFSVSLIGSVPSMDTISICSGGSAVIFGNVETVPNTYSQISPGSNGCDSTSFITLEVSLGATMTFNNTDVSCGTANSGVATVIASGGQPPYSYNWSTNEITQSISNLPIGTYAITITDAAGCASTGSTTIQLSNTLQISETITNVSCGGAGDGQIQVTVNGGVGTYFYQWSNAQTGPLAVNLVPGMYTVSITDGGGCSGVESYTIVEPPLLSATITPTTAGCIGACIGTATWTASGGTPPYSFQWSTFGGTAASISGLCAGNYSSTLEDANGCTIVQPFTIVNSPEIVFTVDIIQNVQCYNGFDGLAQVNITAGSPPFSYHWENGQTTATANVLVEGNHYVIVSGQGGCSTTANFVITMPDSITTSISTMPTSCSNSNDGTAYVLPSGGVPPFNYQWSNGELSNPAQFLTKGVHFLTMTDANGCPVYEQVTIGGPDPLIIDQIVASAPSCFGLTDGQVVVSATGGTSPYFYYWSNNLYGSTITGLSPGVYQLTITDINDCDFGPVNVTVGDAPSPLGISITGTDPSCFAGTDGFATAVASGGVPSYTYAWNNGDVTDTAWDLGLGTQTVTVTDANGCQLLEAVTLGQPDQILAQLGVTDNTCFGEENGEVYVDTYQGGTGQLTYSLDGEFFQEDTLFSELPAGSYTVFVEDEQGCTATFSTYVNEPAEIQLNAGDDVEIDLGDSLQVTVAVSTTDSLVWSWEPPLYLSCSDCPNPVITPLEETEYQIMVLDTNGCMATDDLIVFALKNRNVFIPNAFSPNNDGTNDVFYVFGGPEVATINTFRIFNRWGNMVHDVSGVSPNDPLAGWDGTFKGKKMNPGVLTYFVDVAFVDGVVRQYAGDITLVR